MLYRPYSLAPEGGAFGPRADRVLYDQDWKQLLQAATEDWSERKTEAKRRYLIYTEDFQQLVYEKIELTQQDSETRAQMAKFVDLSMNLGLDVARDVSVVWRHGARRIIEGASTDQQEAFESLVRESRFDVEASRWNQLAFLVGPTTVVPVIRGKRLTWDTLLAHAYDVMRDPENPWGSPKAAAWMVSDSEELCLGQSDETRAKVVYLDDTAWRYFAGRGDSDEIGPPVRHGIDVFPGSTLRCDIQHGTGWWGKKRHKRLVDATVMLGVINSALGFTRKAQNKYLLTVIGNLAGVPTQQKLDPEKPFTADTDAPSNTQVQTLNFDTSPANFIQHGNWIVAAVARAYGAQQAEAANEHGIFGGVVFNHDALTEIRNDQIPFAIEFERELWWKAVAISKAQKHPLYRNLPDPDDVREKLVIEYPRLARSYSDPMQAAQHLDWQLSNGLIDHAEILIFESRQLTHKQAIERIKANITSQMEIIELLTKRNLSMTPGANPAPKVEDVSQINGRIGGQKSRPPTGDDDEKVEANAS